MLSAYAELEFWAGPAAALGGDLHQFTNTIDIDENGKIVGLF